MKKKILFFASLVLMFFTLTSLTSCDKETEYSISMSVASLINNNGNVSDQTKEEIKAAKERIDKRLVEMFGKTFQIKTDEKMTYIDTEKISNYNRRIESDDKILAELHKLAELKTVDGKPAVYSVTFYYYSGDKEFAEFTIE